MHAVRKQIINAEAMRIHAAAERKVAANDNQREKDRTWVVAIVALAYVCCMYVIFGFIVSGLEDLFEWVGL